MTLYAAGRMVQGTWTRPNKHACVGGMSCVDLVLCRVVVRDVQILSRSRMQSSGHTLDLAHLFERRRAIIDSAIIRNLKREKEMSLDNIANKVKLHVHVRLCVYHTPNISLSPDYQRLFKWSLPARSFIWTI